MGTSDGGTGIYCRLSHVNDRDDTTKVDDQERICRQLAVSRGWEVSFVWKDNNRSAWRRDRDRPGWKSMLAAIEAGLISNVIVYHGDRLIRQPYDLEVLINLANDKGIRLASPTGTRNLDSADDRTMLRVEAAFACRESDNISRRKKDGFARMRLEGKAPVPGGIGGRAFGYERDGRTPIAVEADALRKAAERILDGETLAAICRDMDAVGLKSTTGYKLTYATLRDILLRPRTAGRLTDGTPGEWEPIIAPEIQDQVRDTLIARGPTRPFTVEGGKYLLTGIALCWACKKPVQSTTSGLAGKAVKGYGCVTPGCYKVRRNVAHVDAYVIGRVLRLLSTVDFRGEFAMARDSEGRRLAQDIARLIKRRAEAEKALAELHQRDRDDEAGMMYSLMALIRGYNDKIAAKKAEQETPRQRVLGEHKGLTLEEFQALPLFTRRQIIAAAYTITIKRAERMGPGFNPDGVEMKLRED